jgi:preprotein translocase subunit SecY
MQKFLKKLQEAWENPTIKNKIIFTLAMLALYRLLVFIPVPFVHIDVLMSKTLDAGTGASGLGYFLMLL